MTLPTTLSLDSARAALRLVRATYPTAKAAISGTSLVTLTLPQAQALLAQYAPDQDWLHAICDAAQSGQRVYRCGSWICGTTYPHITVMHRHGGHWRQDHPYIGWLFGSPERAQAALDDCLANPQAPQALPKRGRRAYPVPASREDPPTMPTPYTPPQPTPQAQDGQLAQLAAILQSLMGGQTLPPDLLRRLEALEAREGQALLRIELTQPGQAPVLLEGAHHSQMPRLLELVSSYRASGIPDPIAMVGPAGTGKTHAAEACATALGLPYHAISVGPATTQYQIMGYMDAQGRYVRTGARDAYEHGGILLIDEADAASPAAILVLNAMLSNGSVGFPDGVIPRHVDFRCILAMNTWGRGATDGYKRQSLDRALADRMTWLAWPIDEALEASLCGSSIIAQYARDLRSAIRDAGADILISPRATRRIAQLVRMGWSREDVLDAALGYSGMDEPARRVIDRVTYPTGA